MKYVPIEMVPDSEWKELYDKYGEGNTPVLPARSKLDVEKYNDHKIARGMFKQGGSETATPTGTGYLWDESKTVKGSVSIDVEGD